VSFCPKRVEARVQGIGFVHDLCNVARQKIAKRRVQARLRRFKMLNHKLNGLHRVCKPPVQDRFVMGKAIAGLIDVFQLDGDIRARKLLVGESPFQRGSLKGLVIFRPIAPLPKVKRQLGNDLAVGHGNLLPPVFCPV
jgi:hypothetical protein